MRNAVLIMLIAGSFAGTPITLAHLPNSAINAAIVDGTGNIYVAGYTNANSSPGTWDALVMKLGPDGSQVLYSTTLAGSREDLVWALAIDASGAAYILGETRSPDFPVTPGTLQTTFQSSTNQGFVAKIDAQGKVVYSTFIGGNSEIFPYASGKGTLAVDATGNLLASAISPSAGGFVIKIDPKGVLLRSIGDSAGVLALDGQGNVFVAGTDRPLSHNVTPGAFQTMTADQACGGTGQLVETCNYQFVRKLDSDLTHLIYSTYIAGSYGATPTAVFVDSGGNATVAGTTLSADYPTTANAFQPVYVANKQALPTFCAGGCIHAPPMTGYVTKLNSTGTGLLYSTFFGGTQQDSILFAALGSDGLYLSGQAGSADLPGLEGYPSQCLPQPFVTRASPDLRSFGPTRTVPGVPAGKLLAYDTITNTVIAWTGTDLIRFDPAAPPAPVSCILDAVTLQPAPVVVPGDLVSLFGPHLANQTLTTDIGTTTADGVSVTVAGIAAPLLYVSPTQINIQIPFETAAEVGGVGLKTVSLNLMSTETDTSATESLQVTDDMPKAFLNFSNDSCLSANTFLSLASLPVAVNADGTLNSCTNPAKAGSTVKIFIKGLGTLTSGVTGAVNPSPGTPLGLLFFTGQPEGFVTNVMAAPGAISGVFEVDLQLNFVGFATVKLFVSPNSPQPIAIPVGNVPLAFWTKATQ